jgi:hypothetical protein
VTETPNRERGTQPDRAAGEALIAYVPDHPTRRQRSGGWLYAAVTTNPPRGDVDFLTKPIVLTRAAVLPMTLVAGLLAGLLAVCEPGFSRLYFLLALLGVTAAHVANNMMDDLFDTDVGQDTADYRRAQYAPHRILSGLTGRRQLAGWPVARSAWRALSKPPPAEKPTGFPVWPLRYAAWAFLHSRNACAAMIAGVALAASFDVTAF